jgi:UDP-N-acetylmuramyl pentapeptide phosphotransferase/UDP-N-acetylglucosamine-1-phosphate transferase
MALVLTPLTIWLGKHFNIVDEPELRKVHSKKIPRIGGLAIYASMICLVLPMFFLPNKTGDIFREIQPKLVALLLASTIIFLVGLIDDIKQLRARMKLLAQLCAAILVCSMDIRIKSIVVPDLFTIDLRWLSWPLTILWIVGVTNAINISDGIDGLAAGISAITCGVIALFAITSGQIVMGILMLALLGTLTGFICFNFNPAKIFLGDSGSMFLGFIISSSSVMCYAKSSALFGLTLPVLALGIPIFDTLFSMLNRFLNRRSIFAADRNHFHHRLLDKGLNQRHAVIVAYSMTLLTAGLGMFMMVTRNIDSIAVFLFLLLLLFLMFHIVGSIQLRETIIGIQRRYAVTCQIKREKEIFEKVQLHFLQARTFDQWWQALCIAAKQLDFIRLKLPLNDRKNCDDVLTWTINGSVEDEPPHSIKMKIPIHDLESERQLKIEVDVSVNGSLESAGRRAALFSRLLTERKIAELQ